MAFYDSVGGLQDLNKMLASVLSGMGLDDEEVKDIITDPGMQSLLMALGMPEKDALKLVESDDFQLKPLYMSILTDAKRIGIAALEWVKTNGLEFIDKFFTAAQLASKSSNKKVNIVGKLGSSLCLTDKAISRLPKLEAHIRKLQEAKTGGTVSSNSRPTESAQTPKNVALHEKQKVELRREMQAPHVEDPGLRSAFKKLYRENAKVGHGSTAEAIRHEIKTGELVNGKSHIQKGKESVAFLKKWLESNPNASLKDKAAAENVLSDLIDSLNTK